MRPRERVAAWVEAFNRGDPEEMAGFYAEDAVNHQVALAPVKGRLAIRQMFARDFAAAKMICIPENIFEDGAWGILKAQLLTSSLIARAQELARRCQQSSFNDCD